MKKHFLALLAGLLPVLLLAQSKPLLPEELQKLTYQLPDIQPEDSAALYRTIHTLAMQVRTDMEKLVRERTLSDPQAAQTCYELLWYSYTLEDNTGKALENLRRVRSLLTTEADRKTFGLKIESYLRARQTGKQPWDTAFSRTVKQTVLAAYRSLPPAEMNQLVNQAKPSYQDVYKEEVARRIRVGWEQIVKKNGGQLNAPFVSLLLSTYLHHRIHDWVAAPGLAALRELDATDVTNQTVFVPVRDGIKLGGYLFRNAADTKPLPVILSMSPYPNPLVGRYANAFASTGYVYLHVDCRGRGQSEGEFFPFEKDAEDVYDVIDWVAKQPWCNGSVGMTGGSYLGFVQWAAAKTRHPALKAINPMVAVAPGVDYPKQGNIFMPYMLRWLNYVGGKASNDALFMNQPFWKGVYMQWYKNQLPFHQLDSVRGQANPVYQRWLSHPTQDAYWSAMLPTPDEYKRLDIPVFTITGYADADQIGALYYYQQHHQYGSPAALAKHYLLMGPYDHAGAQWMPAQNLGSIAIEKEALIPIYDVVIGWFDWVLKGKAKPALLRDKVNYFVMETGKWKHLPELRGATTDTLKLYLHPAPAAQLRRKATGSLRLAPEKMTRKTTYAFDTRFNRDSLEIFRDYGNLSDSGYLSSRRNLVYESEPLPQDAEISGFMRVQLFMSLTASDADFEVNLYEFTPDGKSFPLGDGILRARYRDSIAQEKPVKPGEINRYDFNQFFFIAKKLRKGSRIRLSFENLNTPYRERNYGRGGVVSRESGKDGREIKATIYQGEKYPSQIQIPYAATRRQ